MTTALSGPRPSSTRVPLADGRADAPHLQRDIYDLAIAARWPLSEESTP